MPRAVPDIALDSIREFHMIAAGDRVAVACSGGADSTALLFLLRELAEQLGWVLSVAHLNHGLRGAESDADVSFVRQLAERLELPCYVERAEVGKLARAARANQEAKARELRLRFFRSLVESGKAARVALAHTADDQAETVLHRFVRGAGTLGLSGIHPVVEGTIIRPLLAVRRPALRDWLAAKGETWREDSSNQDLRFTRNRIRHQVLPLLANLNPRVVETLAHTALLARAEEEFWGEYLKPLCEGAVRIEDGKAVVEIESLRRVPPAVAYRMLRWAMRRVAPSARTDLAHTSGLLRWALGGQSGGQFVLPHQLEARREFSHLILEEAGGEAASREGSRGSTLRKSPARYEYTVQVPGTVTVRELGLAFRFDLVPPAAVARYNETGTVLLDGKVIGFPLLLRNWRAGDAYRPEGHRRVKKLQDLFQRRRVPLGQRSGWPVLVSAGEIVWARGLAAAAGFGASPESAQLVAIREV